MRHYTELDGFQNIYLEDSFVLGIQEQNDIITFELDAVLTEEHEQYSHPEAGEQYCYSKAIIVFPNTSSVSWQKKTMTPSIDAREEIDYGNIDSFTFDGQTYYLSGDWGEVKIVSQPPELILR